MNQPAPTMPPVNQLLASMDYGPSPESADVAQAWLDEHERRFGHFIGGQRVKGERHFDSVNPATGQDNTEVSRIMGWSGGKDGAILGADEISGKRRWSSVNRA